jgi:hypothetical protein
MDNEQQLTKFKEIPWGQIFHVLGDEYAQPAATGDLTEDDEKGLQILLKCLRNPRMGPFIAPGADNEYEDTIEEVNAIRVMEFRGSKCYLQSSTEYRFARQEAIYRRSSQVTSRVFESTPSYLSSPRDTYGYSPSSAHIQ